MNPLKTQVGGGHYKDMAIQPVEFCHKNGLGFIVGCVIKYLCRYKLKKQPVEDLRKARHLIDILIEMETQVSDLVDYIEPTPFRRASTPEDWDAIRGSE